MVKLEEVPDEEFTRAQDGPTEGDDDWDTDSGMLALEATNCSLLLQYAGFSERS